VPTVPPEPPEPADEGEIARSAGEPAREVIWAAWIVAAQALGLVVVALILIAKTIFGEPDDVGRALLDAAFALAGAGILVLARRGLLSGRNAVRSPLAVLELLCLPVSYSLAIQAGRYGYGVPIMLSAIAVLVLLFSPGGREQWEATARRPR
jgi:hypothetical protein